jgi:hypothetical protein
MIVAMISDNVINLRAAQVTLHYKLLNTIGLSTIPPISKSNPWKAKTINPIMNGSEPYVEKISIKI